MHSVETRRFRNCLCVLLCFFFLVVLQILFSLFFRFFLVSEIYYGMFQLLRHSDVTKQGRLETSTSHPSRNQAFEKLFFVVIFCGCVSPCFSDSCSKNYFWCVFRLSTQILSSSTDMHQLRSFFFWFSLTFSFFSFERQVVNPDFFSKKLGVSNFVVSKL